MGEAGDGRGAAAGEDGGPAIFAKRRSNFSLAVTRYQLAAGRLSWDGAVCALSEATLVSLELPPLGILVARVWTPRGCVAIDSNSAVGWGRWPENRKREWVGFVGTLLAQAPATCAIRIESPAWRATGSACLALAGFVAAVGAVMAFLYANGYAHHGELATLIAMTVGLALLGWWMLRRGRPRLVDAAQAAAAIARASRRDP